LSIRQADRPTGLMHRLLVGRFGPDRRGLHDTGQDRGRSGGADYSAAGEGAGILCQTERFLIAGNVTRAIP